MHYAYTAHAKMADKLYDYITIFQSIALKG